MQQQAKSTNYQIISYENVLRNSGVQFNFLEFWNIELRATRVFVILCARTCAYACSYLLVEHRVARTMQAPYSVHCHQLELLDVVHVKQHQTRERAVEKLLLFGKNGKESNLAMTAEYVCAVVRSSSGLDTVSPYHALASAGAAGGSNSESCSSTVG